MATKTKPKQVTPPVTKSSLKGQAATKPPAKAAVLPKAPAKAQAPEKAAVKVAAGPAAAPAKPAAKPAGKPAPKKAPAKKAPPKKAQIQEVTARVPASKGPGLQPLPRNPIMPLQLDEVLKVRVNQSAVERRAGTIGTRRTVKKQWQAAWLLKALQLIDLTTLAGDDTESNVQRLCAKAAHPVRQDLLEAMGVSHLRITTGAVCVYHTYVKTAVKALEGTGVPVAAVSTGFPSGLTPFEQRLEEIKASVADGAREIDIVITRAHVLTGDWQALYDEIKAFREACGDAKLKTIFATGELATLTNVYRASRIAMMAGADFIKTSTGKEAVNATLPFGIVMARAIRDHYEATGYHCGLKPAGGIRTAKQALEWLYLIKEELGDRYLQPDLFRFGASGLLTDIERQLEHYVTGRYAAAYRQPMP